MTGTVVEHPSSARAKQCKKLAEVLTMTSDMLSSAKRGAWEDVAGLEKQRRGKMVDCFNYPFADDDSTLIAEAIAAILHLNDELMGILHTSRAEVMDQGQQVVRGRKAIDNYRSADKAVL